MVREVRKGTAPNVTGRTNINRATPSVRARPVNQMVQPQANTDLSRLSDSLKAVSPGFGKFMQKRQEQFITDETTAGQQAAAMSKKDYDEAIAAGELTPEQSPYFQKAYMKQAGINAGNSRARELMATYNDPANFNRDTGDIDAFLSGQIQGDLEGLDDSDFKSGYLNALKPAEQKIRNDFTEHNINKVRADARKQAYQSYFNAFDTMAQSGDFSLENLDVLAENAQALNLEKSELNGLAYQAAATYALQGEGHPEVFELFKHKGKNGVASLYYTEKYGKQIEAIETQAEAMKNASNSRLNNQVKFVAEREWMQQVEANGGVIDINKLTADIYDKETNPEGRLSASQAEQVWNASQSAINGKLEVNTKMLRKEYRDRAIGGDESVVDEAWANPDITYSQAASIEKLAFDGQQERVTLAQNVELIKSGRSDLLYLLSDPEREDAAQSVFNEELQRNGGDFMAASMSSLESLQGSGEMPPQLKTMLTKANPQNPETWTVAYNTYRALKSQAPAYLDQTFTDSNQIARFDSFEAMTEYGGFTPEQATEELGGMNDKDMEIGRQAFGDKRMYGEMIEEIQDEFGDLANYGTLRNMTEELLRTRLSMPDHPEFTEDLTEGIIERVKNRHVDIGGTWIDRAATGANVQGLSDAVDDYLPEYFANLHPERAIEAKRIVPDQHTSADGTWAVLDQNGARLGRVNPNEMATEYRLSTGDLKTREQMERQGYKHRISELRDELDEIDNAQFGLRSYSEQGKEDPRYKRNAELRAEIMRKLKDQQNKLGKYPTADTPETLRTNESNAAWRF